MTVPVVRSFHGTRKIHEIEIDERADWRRKLLNAIQLNYARAAHFDEVFPALTDPLLAKTDRLAAYNEQAIRWWVERLGLDGAKVVKASTLAVEETGTRRLIEIVRRLGGTAYLYGGGAGGYQEDGLFREAGIELVAQSFEHPVYEQAGSDAFQPGLSIVDAAMNLGLDGTAAALGARAS